MIVIPAGQLAMALPGSEDTWGAQSMATIAKPLAVGKTTVTFAEWDVCVAAGACPQISDNGWGRGDQPAISMSWEEAKGYVAWLKRITGREYRLLTEAEWEYAALAGNRQPYWFGDDAANLGDYAWFMLNARGRPEPVAQKQPNGFGLHDMIGNVWQWVEDCFYENGRNDRYKVFLESDDDEDLASQKKEQSAQSRLLRSEANFPPQPTVKKSSCSNSRRVVRGGSWHMDPNNRSADRSGVYSDIGSITLGFRVARTLNP
jgi:formylglycine-generating enzyme required for sulfatase activity